eukprot:1137875-Pelagomonas_calceolata.AAC.3
MKANVRSCRVRSRRTSQKLSARNHNTASWKGAMEGCHTQPGQVCMNVVAYKEQGKIYRAKYSVRWHAQPVLACTVLSSQFNWLGILTELKLSLVVSAKVHLGLCHTYKGYNLVYAPSCCHGAAATDLNSERSERRRSSCTIASPGTQTKITMTASLQLFLSLSNHLQASAFARLSVYS